MALPSLDFCPLNCHKRSKLKGACLKKFLIIPVKEVALKTINYKTVDANPPAFFFARDFSMSPLEVIITRVFREVMLFRCWHIIPLKMTICFLYRELPYPPPPRSEGNGNSEGGRGPKGGNFRGVGDWLQRFFPGDLGKIGELFINNSFSVEQAISYLAVTGVSKQLLFSALIIFHLRSAKCFFHCLRDRFLSYNCHRLMYQLPTT